MTTGSVLMDAGSVLMDAGSVLMDAGSDCTGGIAAAAITGSVAGASGPGELARLLLWLRVHGASMGASGIPLVSVRKPCARSHRMSAAVAPPMYEYYEGDSGADKHCTKANCLIHTC
jgi:hypothetical protein